jgi:predicted nucleic-acid-binding Zn-ribbon protein
MHWSQEDFERHFKCPKCHGAGALVEELQIGRARASVIPQSRPRYIAVSCALCGYTEFYQTRIAARSEEPVHGETANLAEESEP